MAKKSTAPANPDQTTKLLKDLLIVQLGLAGVPQQKIRKIVGVQLKHVTAIVKLLPKEIKGGQK